MDEHEVTPEELFAAFTAGLESLVIAWKEGMDQVETALAELASALKPSSDVPDVDQER